MFSTKSSLILKTQLMSFEVIIIGGGPAGMSAALVLGRSRIKTLLLNIEDARNLVTTHSHGFLTQDGKHPAEIFSVAKMQLDTYKAVEYKKEKAIEVASTDNGYQVVTAHDTYSAKRVIIATGHRDNIEQLGIEGLTDVYGKSIYPCPFCDGFELADKKLAVIGDALMAPMFAKTIQHWSKDIVVFTNGDKVEDNETLSGLERNGIQLQEEKIKRLHSSQGILSKIELENGILIEREGGFIPDTKSTENTDFAQKLNISTETGRFGMEMYKVDDSKETERKGLYIIGDARTGWSGVATSVAEGSQVGAVITHQIIDENWK